MQFSQFLVLTSSSLRIFRESQRQPKASATQQTHAPDGLEISSFVSVLSAAGDASR